MTGVICNRSPEGLLDLLLLDCQSIKNFTHQLTAMALLCRLVSPDILRLVHDGARMVYVGKQKGFHTRTQDEIHELLCHFAMEGSSVLRLKGGDPFVFGRGGEEVQYLQQRNIKTHVIPGKIVCKFCSAQHIGIAVRRGQGAYLPNLHQRLPRLDLHCSPNCLCLLANVITATA